MENKKFTIAASRGRNNENPTDRTPKKDGSEWSQRLEANEQGICNTLTTVTKDNLVIEGPEKILPNSQTGSVTNPTTNESDFERYPTLKM